MVGEPDTPKVLWETFIPVKPVRWSVKARNAGKIAMMYSPSNLKTYQDQVVRFLKGAYHKDPIDEPIAIRMMFFLPKPKTVTRDYPTVMPDLSNLLKATEDCLTKAGVLRDDSIVINHECWKFYAENEKVGTEITIVGLSGSD